MSLFNLLIKIDVIIACLIILFMILKESKDEGLLENPTAKKGHRGSNHPVNAIMKVLIAAFCLNSLIIANLNHKMASSKKEAIKKESKKEDFKIPNKVK